MRSIRNCLSTLVFIAITGGALNGFSITKEEIITLSRLGISAEEIIKAIEKDKTVFVLKIQDILELKKAGVPEEVIKFMLSTPQKFKKAAEPVTLQPEVKEREVEPEVVEKPKTEEEIKAEEERAREEARKLAEEAKKAEEARKKAYTKGVMKKGLELAEKGKYVEAISLFDRFIQEGNFGPETEEFYNATYGKALALHNGGLKQSAARLFLNVLLSGPDKPFFQSSFNELRKLRKEINYNPPDIEKLSAFFVDNFSQSFQDEFFYVLGEFFYDYGNYQRANRYFEKVSENSKERAKALYLTGLIQVRLKLFKSAVESFQNAILSAEQTGAEQDIVDLSYLALARIAYETLTEDLSNYDAAIYYYRKIPLDSYRLPTALYETAWTYFQKEDYSRALGVIHALRSPYFQDYFFPELSILEATIYLNLCKYDLARKALELFNDEVAQNAEPLRKFMLNQKTPEDYYNSFIAVANGDTSKGLPKKLTQPVLANVEFYNVYRTIRQIEKEEKQLAASIDKLGEFGTALLDKLKMLKKDKINEAGIKIHQILKTLDTDLSEYAVKVTEIELDINTIEIERKTIEMRKLAGEIEEPTLAPKAREGAVAIVGGDTLKWPFEGDYWVDEVRYYRSFLKDECVE